MKKIIAFALFAVLSAAPAFANTLTWQDNSGVEDGFIVKMLQKGNFVEVGRVGPNVTTYTDNFSEGVYLVFAFVKADDGTDVLSPPSNKGVKVNGAVIINVK